MSNDRFRKDYGIECPICKNTYAKILKQNAALYCQKRLRACKKCGHHFTTYERIENRDYALRDRNFKGRIDALLETIAALSHDLHILRRLDNEKDYQKARVFSEPRETKRSREL